MAAKKTTKRANAKKPAARKPAAKKAGAKKPAARKPAARKPAAKKAGPKKATTATRTIRPARKAAAKKAAPKRRQLVGPFKAVLEARINKGPLITHILSQHDQYTPAEKAARRHLADILRKQRNNPSVGRKVRIVVKDMGTNKNAGASAWSTG